MAWGDARKARRKRKQKRQTARQRRKQTKAEGRFSAEAVAGRQGLIGDLGGQAMSIGAGLLGQDAALAAYTGTEPGGQVDYVSYEEDEGIDPMILGIGAVVVVGVIIFAMKK